VQKIEIFGKEKGQFKDQQDQVQWMTTKNVVTALRSSSGGKLFDSRVDILTVQHVYS